MNLAKPIGSIIFGFILELIKTLAIVFFLAFIIRFFLIQPFVVDGQSMQPNFHNKQFILIDKISYRFHEPRKSDVIVFQSVQNPSIYYIKRIIGIPGDTINIKDGKVYVNNNKLAEPYLSSSTQTYILSNRSEDYKITVPQGKYFVLGDNREESSDSREWGLLNRGNIIGRFWLIIYPPKSSYSQISIAPLPTLANL